MLYFTLIDVIHGWMIIKWNIENEIVGSSKIVVFDFLFTLHCFLVIHVLRLQDKTLDLFVWVADFQGDFLRWALWNFDFVVFLQLLVEVFDWGDFAPLVENLNDGSLDSRLVLFGWRHSVRRGLTAAIFVTGVVLGWLFIKDQFFLNVFVVVIDLSLSDEDGFELFLDSGLGDSLDFSFHEKLLVIKFVDVHEVGGSVEFREDDFEGGFFVFFVSELEILFGLGCLSK